MTISVRQDNQYGLLPHFLLAAKAHDAHELHSVLLGAASHVLGAAPVGGSVGGQRVADAMATRSKILRPDQALSVAILLCVVIVCATLCLAGPVYISVSCMFVNLLWCGRLQMCFPRGSRFGECD